MSATEYVWMMLGLMAVSLAVVIPIAKRILMPELFPRTLAQIAINLLIWLLLFVWLPYRLAA